MGEKKFENPQTVNLHKVLQGALSIQELIRDKDKDQGNTPDPGRQRAVSDLSPSRKLMLCHRV